VHRIPQPDLDDPRQQDETLGFLAENRLPYVCVDMPQGHREALLRAAPAFLSAENLLEQAWDEHADPFTNTVTVTIGRLRRKLGDPPVIITTPGVGYRIAGQPGTGG